MNLFKSIHTVCPVSEMQRKSYIQVSFNIYHIIWLQLALLKWENWGWGRPTQAYQVPKSAHSAPSTEEKMNAALLSLDLTRISDKEN